MSGVLSRWLLNGPRQLPTFLNSCSAAVTSENIFWVLLPLVYSADAVAQSARLIRAPAEQSYPGKGRWGRCSPCKKELGKADHSHLFLSLLCGHYRVWEAEHVWSGLWGAPAISASLHSGDTLSYTVQVKPARDKTWHILPFQQHKMHCLHIYHHALCTFPSSSCDVHFTAARQYCRATAWNPGTPTVSHDLHLKDCHWPKKIILAFHCICWQLGTSAHHGPCENEMLRSWENCFTPGESEGQHSCCCCPLHWHLQGDAQGLG